jgi:hypothetical protein
MQLGAEGVRLWMGTDPSTAFKMDSKGSAFGRGAGDSVPGWGYGGEALILSP